MNSYYYLLNIKYKNYLLSSIFIISLGILLVLSIKYETYDKETIIGIVSDNNILINVTNNSDAVQKSSFIKIEGKEYKYSIVNISELMVSGGVNYQIYTINVKEKFKNNEVVKITFYYNKQKIIRKIIDIIF